MTFRSGNRRLPFEDRHSVSASGKITINHVEKTDEDVYKCVVLSLNGERSEQTFQLKVSGVFDSIILFVNLYYFTFSYFK